MEIDHRSVQDPPIYSVMEFCKSHGIGRAMFYKLRKKGEGPHIIKVGRRTLIPGESAAAWRRELLSRGGFHV